MPDLYAQSTLLIVGLLFVLILLVNELAYRVGRWWQGRTVEEIRSQTTAIQASILGLLALLLGFTFTMSMQRFDQRSAAVLDEANAIGTAWLRVELLPEQLKQNTRQLFQQYVHARVESGQVAIVDADVREALQAEEVSLLNQLWLQGVSAADIDPRPVTSGYFIQALNSMIDARDQRSAVLSRHVPPVVLYLLFGVFVFTCGFLGYGAGLGGRRAYGATVLLSGVIVAVMFIVIDLDRPRRGSIQIDQSALVGAERMIARQAEIRG